MLANGNSLITGLEYYDAVMSICSNWWHIDAVVCIVQMYKAINDIRVVEMGLVSCISRKKKKSVVMIESGFGELWLCGWEYKGTSMSMNSI